MIEDVKVPPRRQRLARKTASERNQFFDEVENYDNDANNWGQAPVMRNYFGVLGESAFSIHYDVPIDNNVYNWSDGGRDFHVLVEGVETEIDVKATAQDISDRSVKKKENLVDCYVFCHVVDHPGDSDGWVTVDIVGMATKEMVQQAEIKKSMLYGHKNYVIPDDELLELPSPEQIEPLPDQPPSKRGWSPSPNRDFA